jgi:hypothetical protein
MRAGRLALALTLVVPGVAGAQNAAIILELPASARALSMAGAVTAIGQDDALVFYNPAQLATVRALAASLSLQRYLESTTLAALSAAARFGPGTVGIGVQSLSYGSVDVVEPDCVNFGCERGEPTGATASAGDFVATLGYAARVRGARLGGAAKVVRQGIAGESGTTGAVDLGAAVDLLRHLTIAAAVQNLGGTMRVGGSSGPLPRTLRAGAAFALDRSTVALLVSGDVVQVRDGDPRAAGGIELSWRSARGVSLVGRAGATQRVAESDARAATFGGALRLGPVAIDYGYQGFEALGTSSHRFGIAYRR